MRLKEVVDFSGTATELATEYAVSGYVSPFSRGREAILVVSPSATYDGTVWVASDNTTSGGYTDVLGTSGAPIDMTVKEQTYFRNITLGDNIKVTTASSSTGSLRIMLFGDT